MKYILESNSIRLKAPKSVCFTNICLHYDDCRVKEERNVSVPMLPLGEGLGTAVNRPTTKLSCPPFEVLCIVDKQALNPDDWGTEPS